MKKIRLNITDFKTIIDNDYYYVDKSLLIKDVLNEKVVFRRNRDSSQVEVHIRIDNAWNPHHNDRDQQDQ